MGGYFQGHLHVVHALSHFNSSEHGLYQATTVLVGGCSGGGWSQVINLDYIASQLHASADVRAWINSGLHFDVATYPDFTAGRVVEQPLINQSVAEDVFHSFVDESCRTALGDDWYKCIGFDHAFPHIRTRAFVGQSQYDKVQLSLRLGVPAGSLSADTAKWTKEVTAYVEYFGRCQLRIEPSTPQAARLRLLLPRASPRPLCRRRCHLHTQDPLFDSRRAQSREGGVRTAAAENGQRRPVVPQLSRPLPSDGGQRARERRHSFWQHGQGERHLHGVVQRPVVAQGADLCRRVLGWAAAPVQCRSQS